MRSSWTRRATASVSAPSSATEARVASVPIAAAGRSSITTSRYDAQHLRIGIEGMARILEAAGARRIVLGHAQLVDYAPGRSTVEDYMRAVDEAGFGPGRLSVFSFHQMGSARMGGSPDDSACDPDGQLWDEQNVSRLRRLDVPDGFGVNLMVTIEAIAHMNASALAERLS